jgi:hypothetical protein
VNTPPYEDVPAHPAFGGAASRFSPADQNDLKTLSICHYVYAGILAFTGVIPIGVALFALGVFSAIEPSHPPALKGIVGGVLLIFWGVLTLLLWVKAAFVAYSGTCLRQGKHRTLSQVVACLCCLNMPFGTLLGVFTLVVLGRPSVRAGYEAPG